MLKLNECRSHMYLCHGPGASRDLNMLSDRMFKMPALMPLLEVTIVCSVITASAWS